MAARGDIESREYKVMLDHRLFADRKAASESFWRELQGCAARLERVACDGEFDRTKKRDIVFLDTRDGTIRQNGFVFRQRRDLEKDQTEYTLKCRSPDRFVAMEADIRAAKGAKRPDPKFEEDIGAPFVSRYSRSNTVRGSQKAPKNLKKAANLFRALGDLARDGMPCAAKTPLHPTKSATMFERVLTGPVLQFEKVNAEIALILWSDGAEGRPLVAEFSFRYSRDSNDHSIGVSGLAMEFFLGIQRLDWCLPESRTKTQYIYDEIG